MVRLLPKTICIVVDNSAPSLKGKKRLLVIPTFYPIFFFLGDFFFSQSFYACISKQIPAMLSGKERIGQDTLLRF